MSQLTLLDEESFSEKYFTLHEKYKEFLKKLCVIKKPCQFFSLSHYFRLLRRAQPLNTFWLEL
ncbi:MAG: hypothetical protein M1561_01110 [Gammaproteobacteria bacterium]|nr:hypothetical protein [Gammaproteobacteria bacterium]